MRLRKGGRKINPFRQRIGIWYQDTEWRDKIFDEIIGNLPSEIVLRYHKVSYDMFIKFKDGTTIKFVASNDTARGNAFSRSYIQEGISYEIYQTIINPCNKPYHFDSIVISKFKDFICGGQIASQDYWIWKLKEGSDIDIKT